MEEIGKITGLALITTVFVVLLRDHNKPLSIVVSAVACIGILMVGIQFIKPVLEVVEEIQSLSGLKNTMIQPLIKLVGIGILSNTATTICADAGEVALGKAVEMTGTILAMYVSLPLVLSSLELVKKLVGEIY